jgi:periplasmic protein TonB
MPAELFRGLVAQRPTPGRRLGALPASLLTHAAVLVAAIVIPLLASDVLPPPPSHLTPVLATMPVVPVPQVPRPPSMAPRPTLPADAPGVPLQAPTGVQPETGVERPNTAVIEQSNGDPNVVSGNTREVASLLDPPPPPIVSKPAAPVRVGVVQSPRKIHHEAPVYPQLAIIAKVQGTVVVEAVIGINGQVQDARVIRSIPMLDQAAIDAVKKWVFTPTLLSGVPVPVIMTVQVDFRLR